MRKAATAIGAAAIALAALHTGRGRAGSPEEAVRGPVVYTIKLTVYPGDAIAADMLAARPRAPSLGGTAFVSDPAEAAGKVARRTIVAGQPIPKAALREPYAVQQGRSSTIIYQAGGLTITGVAITLEAGSPGDFISARNQESGLIIKGRVQADGSLQVDGP